MQSESVDLMYNQIIDEAKKEAETVISKANNSAAQRIRLATQEAESSAKKIIAKAEQECALIEKKVMSSIQIEKRKLVLRQQEDLIRDILAQTQIKLKEFTMTPEYKKYMKRNLINSAIPLNQPKINVVAGKNDPEKLVMEVLRESEKEILSKKGKKISFHLETEKHKGCGLIIRTCDGSIQINNTLEEKLVSQLDRVRAYINERLFT